MAEDEKPAEKPAEIKKDVEETPEQEKEEDSQIGLATKVAERLNTKTQELKELEAKIDKKIAEFKKFVGETEIEGKTNAGQPLKTKDQEAIEAAQSLLTGTGLNPFK